MPIEERIALRNPAPGKMGPTIERAKYEQCGLLVRADSETWVTCSAEFETADEADQQGAADA